ncbi:MAG: hypothetical protein ABSE99_11840 [Terracidiphilus sp.]|jgi:hypothetical protein
MKNISAFFLFLASIAACLAQQTTTGTDTSIDPKALLASAAPLYRLVDSDRHPWYLKATYQTYDDQGKPFEEGSYEYWWAAPGRYRASWSRKSASASVWVNGEAQQVFVGQPWSVDFTEGLMGTVFVHPLPAPQDMARFALSSLPLNPGGTSLRCVKISPIPSPDGGGYGIASAPRFSGLCMDPAKPILRMMMSPYGEVIRYGQLLPFQGQYVAREISFSHVNTRVWEAKVEELKEIEADDPALIPPAKAKPLGASSPQFNYPDLQSKIVFSEGSIEKRIDFSEDLAGRLLLDPSLRPSLPSGLDAKKYSHSKVAFQVIIDGTGKIRSARATSGPPELQKAALELLMRYEYRPFHTKNWQPMEIESKVTVKF